jgi:hypothetical protein
LSTRRRSTYRTRIQTNLTQARAASTAALSASRIPDSVKVSVEFGKAQRALNEAISSETAMQVMWYPGHPGWMLYRGNLPLGTVWRFNLGIVTEEELNQIYQTAHLSVEGIKPIVNSMASLRTATVAAEEALKSRAVREQSSGGGAVITEGTTPRKSNKTLAVTIGVLAVAGVGFTGWKLGWFRKIKFLNKKKV